MLDLESEYKIASVKIWNRPDGQLARLQGAEIRVGNVNSFAGNQACASSLPGDAVVTVTCSATGRYVFVVQPRSDTCLHFAEIEVSTVSTVSSTCATCVAGKYAAASASTVCTDCPAGKISVAGATACSNCEAGKYASVAASNKARGCGGGSCPCPASASSMLSALPGAFRCKAAWCLCLRRRHKRWYAAKKRLCS